MQRVISIVTRPYLNELTNASLQPAKVKAGKYLHTIQRLLGLHVLSITQTVFSVFNDTQSRAWR